MKINSYIDINTEGRAHVDFRFRAFAAQAGVRCQRFKALLNWFYLSYWLI